MSVRVQQADFDVSDEIAALTRGNESIGAVATFIGKVRAGGQEATLRSMTLEHYPGMTLQTSNVFQLFYFSATIIK